MKQWMAAEPVQSGSAGSSRWTRDFGGKKIEYRRGAGAAHRAWSCEAAVCRLFIIDGAKALSKAIRNTFGRHTPIQVARSTRPATALPSPCMPASGKRLGTGRRRQGERLIKNLARRLEHDAPGVAAILEGLDAILTVTRETGLPVELRRSLACIENMNGTIRQVCRNVKRWRDAKMALRWTGAAMLEAAKEASEGSKPTSNYRLILRAALMRPTRCRIIIFVYAAGSGGCAYAEIR